MILSINTILDRRVVILCTALFFRCLAYKQIVWKINAILHMPEKNDTQEMILPLVLLCSYNIIRLTCLISLGWLIVMVRRLRGTSPFFILSLVSCSMGSQIWFIPHLWLYIHVLSNMVNECTKHISRLCKDEFMHSQPSNRMIPIYSALRPLFDFGIKTNFFIKKRAYTYRFMVSKSY